MKQYYYERIRTERIGVHKKRKALGTKHILCVKTTQIVVFYNAERGTMTEETTGLLVATKFTLKEDREFVFAHFDEIVKERDRIAPQLKPLSELEEEINPSLLCI